MGRCPSGAVSGRGGAQSALKDGSFRVLRPLYGSDLGTSSTFDRTRIFSVNVGTFP